MAYLKVRLVHSAICRERDQKQTLRGLGLRRPNHETILQDTPAIRGMIQKVIHLVRFEKTADSVLPKKVKQVTYRLGALPTAAPAKVKKIPTEKTSAKKKPAAKSAAKPKAATTKTRKKS